jgi:hypothetical protein
VIPVSQKDVDTVKLIWLLGGAVCRVTQRPAGTTSTQLIALVSALDKLAQAGAVITETTQIPNMGKVVSAAGGLLEVKLKNTKRTGSAPIYNQMV